MDVKGFTIDRVGTLDINNAIWVESDSRGWTLTVSVANVAAAISKDSTFDHTAFRRAQTLLLAGNRTKPMIPRRFSEGSCSLFEGETRSVMAIRVRLDHMLEPRGLPQIDESKLISKKNLSYSDIPAILEDESSQLHKQVSSAARLARALADRRRSHEVFALYDLSGGRIMTESGRLRKIEDAREMIGHVIVQELTALANMEVARFCLKKDIQVPFRNQKARDSSPPRKRILELLEQSVGGSSREFDRAQESFMMVMAEADYGPSTEGHYGMNLDAYLHVDSPISRFADLVVQRQIIGYLNGKGMPYSDDEVREMCKHINAVMRSRAGGLRTRAKGKVSGSRTSKLSIKDFSIMVKSAVQNGTHRPDVAIEFLRRLKKGEESSADTYYLLLESGDPWIETRKSILSHLIENPNKAADVANVARQIGGWSEPKFLIHQKGNGRSLVHEATVKFDKPKLDIGPAAASSKKVARQMAIVDAFAEYIHEPEPEWVKSDAESSAATVLNLDSDTINPIGELMEYCQSSGIELPQYVYDHQQHDGGPKFVVSCKAAGVHVKSSPYDSKKQAKKESARRAIQLILERV